MCLSVAAGRKLEKLENKMISASLSLKFHIDSIFGCNTCVKLKSGEETFKVVLSKAVLSVRLKPIKCLFLVMIHYCVSKIINASGGVETTNDTKRNEKKSLPKY